MAYEVTIGIPVYNVEKYIRLTMDSALAQTFDSIEFLVLDDCGTDSSIDIVREYQQTHARGKDIRIVRQPQNGGIGRARNRIVEEAQGRYLYFLDADDLMISTTISLMMSAVLKYNAEIVMASYQQVELYNDKPQNKLFHFSHLFFSKPDELATYAFSHYGALQANIWNVLLDLNIVRKYHLQFVNTNFWEDMVFKYDLVTYVTRAVLLPDVTYSYMCRENTLSNFQKRDTIGKDEILRNVETMNTLKYRYERLLGRPYFSKWLNFILDTDYYIISEVLKKRDKIYPWISDLELRSFLHSPLSIFQTLRYGNYRSYLYKLLSILPEGITVRIIKNFVGRKLKYNSVI